MPPARVGQAPVLTKPLNPKPSGNQDKNYTKPRTGFPDTRISINLTIIARFPVSHRNFLPPPVGTPSSGLGPAFGPAGIAVTPGPQPAPGTLRPPPPPRSLTARPPAPGAAPPAPRTARLATATKPAFPSPKRAGGPARGLRRAPRPPGTEDGGWAQAGTPSPPYCPPPRYSQLHRPPRQPLGQPAEVQAAAGDEVPGAAAERGAGGGGAGPQQQRQEQ